MTIYIIHWLAKEIESQGSFVSSMIELATTNKAKAEKYYNTHHHDGQVTNVDNHMCEIRRQLVQIEVED